MTTTHTTSPASPSGKLTNSLPDKRFLRTTWSVILLLATALAGRLIYVQVINRAFYLGIDQRIHPAGVAQHGQPGAILDRHGQILATSAMTASLRVNPTLLRRHENPQAVATYLAGKLDMSEQEVLRILDRDTNFAYLQRRIPFDIAQGILAQQYTGLAQDLEYKRAYPQGSNGCHLIGCYSSDQRPLEGIEYRYRFVLAGQPGLAGRSVDAWGRTIVGQEADAGLPPVPGKDVVLTVDSELQRVVEDALDRCWTYNRPSEATAVVMDPRTGEILALASRPDYDPNLIASAGRGVEKAPVSPKDLRNLPVTREYEPGSTFKVLLAAAALESGAVKENDRFFCGGTTMVGGKPLRCWVPKGHGSLNIAGVLAESCNIGAAQIAMKIGPERFHQFLRNCGIGSATGIGLPGEVTGRLQSPQTMRIRDVANMGFGQNVAVTDINLLAAMSAVVNGGILMQARVVSRVVNPDGSVYREVKPRAVRSVCSKQTSDKLRKLLRKVVEEGTGRPAQIPGVAVGGKTGTAQIWDPKLRKWLTDQHLVSFVLVAPVDKQPEFVILVTARNPQRGQHGADVAAPVAREIAVFMLKERRLLPEEGMAAVTGS